MPAIKLTDGSTISFIKGDKKKRYFMSIYVASLKRTITIHLDRKVLNLLQFEIDDLLGENG